MDKDLHGTTVWLLYVDKYVPCHYDMLCYK